MKKIIVALLALTVSVSVFAQNELSKPTAPAPAVISLDTQVVGGQTFYIIADQLDSIYSNIRVVIAPIAENPPKTAQDWILLFFKLLTSGVLASIASQGVKVWKTAQTLFAHLRNEWIVFGVSVAIGGAWLYLDTKFAAFDFTDLFYRTSAVFTVAIVAWRAGLSKLFQKKQASTPTA